MAGFDKTKVRTAFSIPDDFDVCAAWAIGYLGDPNVLPGPYIGFEKSPRSQANRRIRLQ
jgi:hypothetical protein